MSIYTFPQLPYSYEALEPFIDRATMEIHYSRHHKAYYDNFVANIGADSGKSLEEIFAQMENFPPVIRNNAGGLFNHTLFWNCMKPNGGGEPTGELAEAIKSAFGDFATFKAQFKDAGIKQFGSGWAWLIVNKEGKLQISSTPNQDNPLMSVSSVQGTPILACDVWEHAYYLNYQNKRADYLENWFNIINWNYVAQLFAEAK